MQITHRRHKANAFAGALPLFGQALHRGDGGDDSHTGKVSLVPLPINSIVGFVTPGKNVGSTRVPRVQCGVPLHCFCKYRNSFVPAIYSNRSLPTVSGETPETTRGTRVLPIHPFNNHRRWCAPQARLSGASGTRSFGCAILLASSHASTSSPLMSASIWPSISTHGLSI